MDVLAKAVAAIEQADMLSPGGRVAVALSGGADSVALLHVLLALRDRLPLREVVAVHVNHQLRGEESLRDEAFVRELCRDWEIPLRVYRRDVASLAREAGKGIEETGRDVRYALFDEVSALYGHCPVATAHTRSDNIETLLLHLVRGCGPRGLAGIPPVRGRIIRPLLGCTRGEIEGYCRDNGLPYVSDSTNADVRYARNRIRSRVVPECLALNPRFAETAGRFLTRMARVSDLLYRLAAEALEAAALPEGYDRMSLRRLDPAVKAEALRLAAERAGSVCEERHVTRLERLLDETGGCTLPGNIQAAVTRSALRFSARIHELDAEWGPMEAAPGQTIRIIDRNFRLFLFSLEDKEKGGKIHRKLLKSSLDYDKIMGSLKIRRRNPGDAYHPVGRQGGKTLKKLFNEAHLPPAFRDRVPVLCDDAGILLVPGFGCDVRAAVDQDTRRLLVLEEERAPDERAEEQT